MNYLTPYEKQLSSQLLDISERLIDIHIHLRRSRPMPATDRAAAMVVSWQRLAGDRPLLHDDVELSNRARRALHRLADGKPINLSAVTAASLAPIKNCGEQTTAEILAWVARQ